MSKLSEHAIVYVDDETLSLKYFEKAFSEDFHIFTASNALDAWDIVTRHADKIGLLMSDQRMPNQTGVQLLEKVRLSYPNIIRILVTAYSDVESAVAGINSGAIYRYISKPWDVIDLRLTMLRSVEFYGVIKDRDQLLREKLSVMQHIVLSDRAKNLGVLAAGLGCEFRNALPAANEFVNAIPLSTDGGMQQELLQSGIGKRIENLITGASEGIFRIARDMRKLTVSQDCSDAKPEPFEEILRPILHENSSFPDLNLSLEGASEIPPIRAHHPHIIKLFSNLLNCIHSIDPDRETVRLKLREIKGEEGNSAIETTFADDGPSWTVEQKSRLFSPFSDTGQSSENVGLDLAVCYFLVHHYGGHISILGEPGARIKLQLPINPELNEETELAQEQLMSLFRHERFLDHFVKSSG